jgi:hypothetical protein
MRKECGRAGANRGGRRRRVLSRAPWAHSGAAIASAASGSTARRASAARERTAGLGSFTASARALVPGQVRQGVEGVAAGAGQLHRLPVLSVVRRDRPIVGEPWGRVQARRRGGGAPPEKGADGEGGFDWECLWTTFGGEG